MRIAKIKISGFKSFVDPTTLELPGNLTGIVGPNGCGKSNIIDAVLWVLGENSAKHLRGDSMADVVFNGSNTRKPVGQAAVEVIFDNSDGKIGGQYASYGEISIKRQVGRDGISTYFLNGTRCRRRDITHIFLGTGIGSRTYSVIEQGMISRVIEAKPEDLRLFLEEAAGISKYKERRRETENRIRSANENIARLNDIRSELDKQLQHLNRQAKAAEKYQQLKQEERLAQAQLHALRWRDLKGHAEAQRARAEQCANAVEATAAALRSTETEIAASREVQIAANDRFNEVQSAYYSVGADLARLEQSIQHAQERRQATERELSQAGATLEETRRQVAEDELRRDRLAQALKEIEPQRAAQKAREDEASARVNELERQMHEWQHQWDGFNQQAADTARAEKVEQTRLEHLEDGVADAQQRIAALQEERAVLLPDAIAAEIETLNTEAEAARLAHEELDQSRDSVQSQIAGLRREIDAVAVSLDELRQERQVLRGRTASVEALQQSALGMDREGVREWLQRFHLADASRLASALSVESGWERALETVIRIPLETLCVDDLDVVLAALPSLSEGRAGAICTARPAFGSRTGGKPGVASLADKVSAPWPIDDLIAGVYAVDTLEQARALQPQLDGGESVVTREGVWMGPGWVYASRDRNQGGVLARVQELKQLVTAAAAIENRIAAKNERLDDARARLAALEAVDRDVRTRLDESHGRLAALRAELAVRQSRLEQIRLRLARVDAEIEDLGDQIAADGDEILNLRARLQGSRFELETLEAERTGRIAERDRLRAAVQAARDDWRLARDAVHELALRFESQTSERTAVEQALGRNHALIERLAARRDELQQALRDSEAPLRALQQDRERVLAQRLKVEADLAGARNAVQSADLELRALEDRRLGIEREMAGRRDELEQARVELRTLEVRLQNLQEQVDAAEFQLEALLGQLPADASEAAWEETVTELGRRIQRLGPINLAAIEEFATLSERKEYLDRQHADLAEALATLEEAIRKIDRETRTRFKETYDKVNTGFQSLFPVLFGGGHAYLELTGEDLLETGVTVMARPPGKRNSTIHLLSGGEKALTAVSLVFAIFELNPAPFCLLDEVDAPLDDANVVRLSDMLRDKARSIQFLFITHNKITMEIAHQLVGVTMQEAGVSRLVAVNMDEAVTLAATA